MAHSYVWLGSFVDVTWCILTCDIKFLYALYSTVTHTVTHTLTHTATHSATGDTFSYSTSNFATRTATHTATHTATRDTFSHATSYSYRHSITLFRVLVFQSRDAQKQRTCIHTHMHTLQNTLQHTALLHKVPVTGRTHKWVMLKMWISHVTHMNESKRLSITLDRALVYHTATHYNTLQHAATHCSLQHCVEPWYTTLQHAATRLQHCVEPCYTRLQHAATRCNTRFSITPSRALVYHTATYYNVLQHTATHCNTMLSTTLCRALV